MHSVGGAKPELKEKLKVLAQKLAPIPWKFQVSHRGKTVSGVRPCKMSKVALGPDVWKFLAYGPAICPKDKIGMTPRWGLRRNHDVSFSS
jgi:hypothetical protein